MNLHFTGLLFKASTVLLTLYNLIAPVPLLQKCPPCKFAFWNCFHYVDIDSFTIPLQWTIDGPFKAIIISASKASSPRGLLLLLWCSITLIFLKESVLYFRKVTAKKVFFASAVRTSPGTFNILTKCLTKKCSLLPHFPRHFFHKKCLEKKGSLHLHYPK